MPDCWKSHVAAQIVANSGKRLKFGVDIEVKHAESLAISIEKQTFFLLTYNHLPHEYSY